MDNEKNVIIAEYELPVTFEERTSTKTNKRYKALFVKIAPDYDKIVFLSKAEQIMLENNN